MVFVADRRSGGGYLRLLGVPGLEETLLDKPTAVRAADGTALRASEFAYPAALPVGAEPLASIPHGSATRSPVLAVPAGAGLLISRGCSTRGATAPTMTGRSTRSGDHGWRRRQRAPRARSN